jgi:AmiR/NasT family two-component response regulator
MDMDLVAYQTAAKERIRWLSVRLALSEAAGLAMAARLEALTGGLPNIDAWERAAALLGESFGIGREAAHQIIRTDAGAKRIYDCALQTIANLEARK